jgi:hypothetical protein
MREPAGVRASAYAPKDDTQKRHHDQWSDRRAAEGHAARPVAEGDEEGQRHAKQADQDRLLAAQQPVADLVLGKKRGGYGNGRHVIGEGVGCGDKCCCRQGCRLKRITGQGPPDEPHDNGRARGGRALHEPGQCRAAIEVANNTVDGLDVPPFGARVVRACRLQDLAGLRRELLRQGFPHGAAKYGDRYAGEYGGCRGRTRKGAPLTGRGERHRQQDSELRLIGQGADKQAGKHRMALEQQQRCAEQRARQKPVLPSEKVPHRKRRGQHQSDCGQPLDDQIGDSKQAEQGDQIPDDEPRGVREHRERRQDQKECRGVRPIRVEIIPRPNQRRLDLDEFGRVVQPGGIAVQRLHRGGPCASEIGVDRHAGAVDEPGSRPPYGDQKRGVDRGDGKAVGVQPPARKEPEARREVPVDFRGIGKARHPAIARLQRSAERPPAGAQTVRSHRSQRSPGPARYE